MRMFTNVLKASQFPTLLVKAAEAVNEDHWPFILRIRLCLQVRESAQENLKL
jgi:hypothetical protein